MENNNVNEIDYDCKKIIERKDYYEILDLGKNASEEEIRKSYKKLAIKFHPDKNKSKLAEEAFKKISHSFHVLSNKEKKSNYDKYGTEDEVIASRSRNNFKYNYHNDIDPFVKLFINIIIL
jgi:DnaJ-class molecular chaperone